MKRRILLTIGIILTVGLIGMTVSDSNVEAQRNRVFRANAGMVDVGPNQKLFITVASLSQNEPVRVRFIKSHYQQLMCNGSGMCQYSSDPQTVSPPITLMPGEASTLELLGPGNWFMAISSDSPNVHVNAFIKDNATGAVVSTFHIEIDGQSGGYLSS